MSAKDRQHSVGFRERLEHDRLRQFAKWLIEMDDPDNPVGLERRRSITLTSIIDYARNALQEGEPCGGPAPPQTFHYGPHPACPECGMGGDVGADTPNPIPF